MLISIASLGALIAVSMAIMNEEPPKTSLFANISTVETHDQRQSLLAQRIGERYGIGRPEAGLDKYLIAQGFEAERVASSDAPGEPIYGQAEVRYGPGRCKMIASVNWRANAQGNLTELNILHTADVCIG